MAFVTVHVSERSPCPHVLPAVTALRSSCSSFDLPWWLAVHSAWWKLLLRTDQQRFRAKLLRYTIIKPNIFRKHSLIYIRDESLFFSLLNCQEIVDHTSWCCVRLGCQWMSLISLPIFVSSLVPPVAIIVGPLNAPSLLSWVTSFPTSPSRSYVWKIRQAVRAH